jgi:DNA mismatch endonuclease, patch repair protein
VKTTAFRSALMARVGSRHTKPELTVRSTLHGLGFRFRLHDKSLPGSPDLVLKRHGVVLLVHGCFWHGHDCRHGRFIAKTNTDFWVNKIAANKMRDSRVKKELRAQGWKVVEIWECKIKKDDWLLPVLKVLAGKHA